MIFSELENFVTGNRKRNKEAKATRLNKTMIAGLK
jgi:hypothetical protein